MIYNVAQVKNEGFRLLFVWFKRWADLGLAMNVKIMHNKALHWTAIPLRSIAASELGR